MRTRRRFRSWVVLAAGMLFSTAAFSEVRTAADDGQLQRVYAANEWHMKRFMYKYLDQEKEVAANPGNDHLKIKLDSLKHQIDVLSRENERILNQLDEAKK